MPKKSIRSRYLEEKKRPTRKIIDAVECGMLKSQIAWLNIIASRCMGGLSEYVLQ